MQTPEVSGLARLQRRPRRISATLPAEVVERLIHRSDLEGRSLSNLVAHLLELAVARPS